MSRRKELREQERLHNDFFEQEELKIQKKLSELEVGSEEYETTLNQFKTAVDVREKRKESRRKLSKADKGQMLIKGIGVLGIIGACFGISRFEMKGNTFTGEKRTWIDTLIGNLGRFNLFR